MAAEPGYTAKYTADAAAEPQPTVMVPTFVIATRLSEPDDDYKEELDAALEMFGFRPKHSRLDIDSLGDQSDVVQYHAEDIVFRGNRLDAAKHFQSLLLHMHKHQRDLGLNLDEYHIPRYAREFVRAMRTQHTLPGGRVVPGTVHVTAAVEPQTQHILPHLCVQSRIGDAEGAHKVALDEVLRRFGFQAEQSERRVESLTDNLDVAMYYAWHIKFHGNNMDAAKHFQAMLMYMHRYQRELGLEIAASNIAGYVREFKDEMRTPKVLRSGRVVPGTVHVTAAAERTVAEIRKTARLAFTSYEQFIQWLRKGPEHNGFKERLLQVDNASVLFSLSKSTDMYKGSLPEMVVRIDITDSNTKHKCQAQATPEGEIAVGFGRGRELVAIPVGADADAVARLIARACLQQMSSHHISAAAEPQKAGVPVFLRVGVPSSARSTAMAQKLCSALAAAIPGADARTGSGFRKWTANGLRRVFAGYDIGVDFTADSIPDVVRILAGIKPLLIKAGAVLLVPGPGLPAAAAKLLEKENIKYFLEAGQNRQRNGLIAEASVSGLLPSFLLETAPGVGISDIDTAKAELRRGVAEAFRDVMCTADGVTINVAGDHFNIIVTGTKPPIPTNDEAVLSHCMRRLHKSLVTNPTLIGYGVPVRMKNESSFVADMLRRDKPRGIKQFTPQSNPATEDVRACYSRLIVALTTRFRNKEFSIAPDVRARIDHANTESLGRVPVIYLVGEYTGAKGQVYPSLRSGVIVGVSGSKHTLPMAACTVPAALLREIIHMFRSVTRQSAAASAEAVIEADLVEIDAVLAEFALAAAEPQAAPADGKYVHAIDGKVRGLLQLMTKWTATEKNPQGKEDMRQILIQLKKFCWDRLSEDSQKKLLELK